jgi:tetratricopeptide (TPR) repeat protein
LAEQIKRFGLDILRAHDMADLLRKGKKYDEAELILQNVLDQDTGGVTAEKIGDLEYKQGHYDRVIDWYRRSIEEGWMNPFTYSRLANAFTCVKDWKGAESAYLRGIAENPKHAFLYWTLGSWYEKRGRVVEAEKMYRKGCDMPIDFPEYAPAVAGGVSGYTQERDIASCYRLLAFLLGRVGRQAEQFRVLDQGMARLEKALASTDQARKESVEERLAELKGELAQAYLNAGRQNDVLSFVDAELKRRPVRTTRTRKMVELLNLLGMWQKALEVARLAEYTTLDVPSNDRAARQLARSIVDGQLRQTGLLNELKDRLEARRASGEELEVMDYRWLGTNIYQGAEAIVILE